MVIKVAQAVSSGIGSEFFDLLTRNMVEALGAHGGLIGRLNVADNTITTLSYFLSGNRMDNVSYFLNGTPCENVINGDLCITLRFAVRRWHHGSRGEVGAKFYHFGMGIRCDKQKGGGYC